MPAMKRAGELPPSAETSAPKGARQAPSVHDQLDVDTIYKGTLMQQYVLFAWGNFRSRKKHGTERDHGLYLFIVDKLQWLWHGCSCT